MTYYAKFINHDTLLNLGNVRFYERTKMRYSVAKELTGLRHRILILNEIVRD